MTPQESERFRYAVLITGMLLAYAIGRNRRRTSQ